MTNKKGFTLIELAVVIVIIGIVAVIALPAYFTLLEQGRTQSTLNNLKVIAIAQKTYFLNNNTYCVKENGNFCDSLNSTPNSIDTVLSLNLNDNDFTYYCSSAVLPSVPSAGRPYCRADRNSSGVPVAWIFVNTSAVIPGFIPYCVGANCP